MLNLKIGFRTTKNQLKGHCQISLVQCPGIFILWYYLPEFNHLKTSENKDDRNFLVVLVEHSQAGNLLSLLFLSQWG